MISKLSIYYVLLMDDFRTMKFKHWLSIIIGYMIFGIPFLSVSIICEGYVTHLKRDVFICSGIYYPGFLDGFIFQELRIIIFLFLWLCLRALVPRFLE